MSTYGESSDNTASGDKSAGDVLLVDDPLPGVRRLTMNRPDKRNSLIHPLRGAILEALREADLDSCLLYTSPSPRDKRQSRMPSSA